MTEIDDIIRFENENTCLDFKTIQYTKDKFEDFIKDIVAMANANSISDRYIIIGVNHKSNGDRIIVGLTDDFIDDSIYQQLINENIEPELGFKYYPYQIDNKKVGIIQIVNFDNPPYMLKKDFGKLRKGDSFIRKGSHQSRLTRSDIDKIISKKILNGQFKGDISISLISNNEKCAELKSINDIRLPSDEMAMVISSIIKVKELKEFNSTTIRDEFGFLEPEYYLNPIFGGVPYENRTIDVLREDLNEVKKTYLPDDLYYLFEERAIKLNFELINNGDAYLEDSSVEFKIKKHDGLLIAKEINYKPDSNPVNLNNLSWESRNYPYVEEVGSEYRIFQNIGDLKHKMSFPLFEVPIRFFINDSFVGDDIEFLFKIFAKNLINPIEKKLSIRII